MQARIYFSRDVQENQRLLSARGIVGGVETEGGAGARTFSRERWRWMMAPPAPCRAVKLFTVRSMFKPEEDRLRSKNYTEIRYEALKKC